MYFTLDFSSSSKTGFLGRGGGEGISVLSMGMGGSDCTMPEETQMEAHVLRQWSLCPSHTKAHVPLMKGKEQTNLISTYENPS